MAGESQGPGLASILGGFTSPFGKPYTINGQRMEPDPVTGRYAPAGPPPGEIAPGVRLANPTPPDFDFNKMVQQNLAAQGAIPPPAPEPKFKEPPPPPVASAAAPAGGLPLPSGGWGGAGGVGGTARLPATNVPTTDPRYIKQMEDAYVQQQAAYDTEKSAQSLLAAAEASKHEKEALGLSGEEAALFKGKQDLERQTKERREKSDEFLKKIDEYSAKISEEKIEKPGAFDQVRWTIASMFGAVQQGFLGLKTNQIADQVQQIIATDIERQKAEFERHKGRKEDMKSIYAQAYNAMGDEMEATKLANGIALEMAKKETQSLVAHAESEVAREKGTVLTAAIDTKKAQLAGQEAESEMKTHKYTPSQTVSTGPSQASLLKRVQEIRNKGAEHGQDVSPQEAYRQAYIEATGKDPYGKAGEGVPLASYAKGDKEGPAGGDPALKVINSLKGAPQTQATKEYETAKKASMVLQNASSIFDKYRPGNDIGAFDRQRDLDRSNFVMMIKPLTDGMSSDDDKRDLAATMPQYGDSPETYAAKRASFESIIRRNAQTPILDSYGVAPKVEGGNAAPTKSFNTKL